MLFVEKETFKNFAVPDEYFSLLLEDCENYLIKEFPFKICDIEVNLLSIWGTESHKLLKDTYSSYCMKQKSPACFPLYIHIDRELKIKHEDFQSTCEFSDESVFYYVRWDFILKLDLKQEIGQLVICQQNLEEKGEADNLAVFNEIIDKIMHLLYSLIIIKNKGFLIKGCGLVHANQGILVLNADKNLSKNFAQHENIMLFSKNLLGVRLIEDSHYLFSTPFGLMSASNTHSYSKLPLTYIYYNKPDNAEDDLPPFERLLKNVYFISQSRSFKEMVLENVISCCNEVTFTDNLSETPLIDLF